MSEREMDKELEKLAYLYGGAHLKNLRKKRRKRLIADLCVDYTKNSTLHGLRYFTASGLCLVERIFWVTTFLVSVGFCTYLIRNVYHKWTTSPVIVTVNERLISVGNVPFPSVTICPQIKSMKTKYNFGNMINEYKRKNISNPDYAKLIDISIICNYHKRQELLSNRNCTDSTLVKNIEEVAPSLDEIFDKCYWHGKYFHCRKLFATVYTGGGLCFNMNGLEAKEILRDTVQTDYNYSARSLPNRGWSLEGGYTDTGNPFPKRGNKNYAKPDLIVYLRNKDEDRDAKCNGLRSGYEIYLHHPADFPQSSLYHYSAVNDQVTSLAVSVHVESTSDALSGYSPEVRQCFFPLDRPLRYFRSYTAKNCEAECLSNYTYGQCGCVGFYMPHDNSSEICAEQKLQCMKSAHKKMSQNELSYELGLRSRGCHCLPACESIEYDAEVLQTDFVSDNYSGKTRRIPAGSFYNTEHNETYNMSKVEIYFKRPQFMSTRRSELFGTTDFLANIGGLLGVFLGFSFLSLVEIVYFFTLRIGVALKQDYKKEKKNNPIKNNIHDISHSAIAQTKHSL